MTFECQNCGAQFTPSMGEYGIRAHCPACGADIMMPTWENALRRKFPTGLKLIDASQGTNDALEPVGKWVEYVYGVFWGYMVVSAIGNTLAAVKTNYPPFGTAQTTELIGTCVIQILLLIFFIIAVWKSFSGRLTKKMFYCLLPIQAIAALHGFIPLIIIHAFVAYSVWARIKFKSVH